MRPGPEAERHADVTIRLPPVVNDDPAAQPRDAQAIDDSSEQCSATRPGLAPEAAGAGTAREQPDAIRPIAGNLLRRFNRRYRVRRWYRRRAQQASRIAVGAGRGLHEVEHRDDAAVDAPAHATTAVGQWRRSEERRV